MTPVFIRRPGGRPEELARSRCSNEERDLQDALLRNPALLPGDQISPENPRRWMLVKREIPIPDPNDGQDRWSLDFLFVDQEAVLTLVECKRHDDTRARREVVGQVLEYVANAQFYWDAATLAGFAEGAAIENGTTLAGAIVKLHPDEPLDAEDPQTFFEQAVANLKAGKVRVIFFLDEAPRELKNLAEFLNQQMSEAEFLVIEAKHYIAGDGVIIVPSLFGYTEQARQNKAPIRFASPSGTGRRKWDEATVLADAKERLPGEAFRAVQRLLEFAKATADTVKWGTGAKSGSFSPRYLSVCARSPITVFSHGGITLNLGYISGSDAAIAAKAKFMNAIKDLGLRDLGPDDSESFPGLAVETWPAHVEKLIQVLQDLFIVSPGDGNASSG